MPFAVTEKGITVGTTPRPLSSGGDYRCSTPTTIIVWNVGSTSIWGRTDGGLATTAWPSREVPAGQPREFILTPENGDAILSLIAATSAVNATLQVFTFRSALVAELVSAAALMAVFFLQSFWEAVSGTVVRLSGSYVEAQADTYRAKTTNANTAVRSRSGETGSVILGDTTTNPAGNNDVLVGKANTWTMEFSSSQLDIQDNATSGGKATWGATALTIKAADPTNNTGQDSPVYAMRAKNNVATVISNFDSSLACRINSGGGAANPDIDISHQVDGVYVVKIIKRNQNSYRGFEIATAIDITAVTPAQAGTGKKAYDSTYGRWALSDGTDWIVS